MLLTENEATVHGNQQQQKILDLLLKKEAGK